MGRALSRQKNSRGFQTSATARPRRKSMVLALSRQRNSRGFQKSATGRRQRKRRGFLMAWMKKDLPCDRKRELC
jgi:hypothetical protein